jgi:putative salt-induced outer membrane protein
LPRALSLALIAICSAGAALAQSAAAASPPATAFTADAGLVSASGNTQLRTLSLGDKLVHTAGRWVVSQLAAYIYGETQHVTSANQLRAALRGDYTFAARLAVFAAGSFERNRFAGFTRRTDEMLGLSWKALELPMDSLAIDAGGVLTQQKFVDSTEENFPAGRLAGAYKHAFTKASYFVQLAEYLPNLQSTGEYRVNTESDLVAPLSTHAGVKVGYVVRFDSAPALGFGTTDRILTAGIQIAF